MGIEIMQTNQMEIETHKKLKTEICEGRTHEFYPQMR